MPRPVRPRRVRVPKTMPAPPSGIEFRWADSRVELAGFDAGDVVRLCLAHTAWQATVGAVCEAVDASAPSGKVARLYSAGELEAMELYRRLSGARTTREARDRLAGDRGLRARVALGFDRPREANPAPMQILMAGVPSEATVSRHRARLDANQLAHAYEAFFAVVRDEHLACSTPGELQVLGLDGTTLRCHGVAPRLDPDTGEVVNADRVTVPEAGYLPPSRTLGEDKSGDGWKLVHVTTAAGAPLDYRIVRIHESEVAAATDMFNGPLWDQISSYWPDDQVAVLSADAGLHSQPLRAALRRRGIIESIHLASHSDHPNTRANVRRLDTFDWSIQGYPHWAANSHREIACDCGQGTTSKRVWKGANGHAHVTTEGRCENCGPISLTSGDWRTALNPKRFTRTTPTVEPTEASVCDLSFGNPLTYHDPLSRAYGRARFGHLEGFHGTLERRFKLIKHKRYFRTLAQVRTEIAAIMAALHVLALHQRALQLAATHLTTTARPRELRASSDPRLASSPPARAA